MLSFSQVLCREGRKLWEDQTWLQEDCELVLAIPLTPISKLQFLTLKQAFQATCTWFRLMVCVCVAGDPAAIQLSVMSSCFWPILVKLLWSTENGYRKHWGDWMLCSVIIEGKKQFLTYWKISRFGLCPTTNKKWMWKGTVLETEGELYRCVAFRKWGRNKVTLFVGLHIECTWQTSVASELMGRATLVSNARGFVLLWSHQASW